MMEQQHSDGDLALEAIKVKILLLGDEGAPHSIRVELSSEADLFFHYMHVVDEVGFRMMQESQKLMVDFAEYPSVLVRMINSCIKDPNSHLAVFVMKEGGRARLEFIRNMEYKFVELLNINFVRSPEDLVQQHITYRYNAIKSRLAIMQSRLADVNALVKVKNPSLLLQIEGSRRPGRGSPSKPKAFGH